MSNTPSKKDVDDLVYSLRQKGDDSTYALVVEALAKWGTPQSVVREPLTHDEALDAFCHTPGIYQFVQAFMAGVRFAEQAHGITQKGGQHGAE